MGSANAADRVTHLITPRDASPEMRGLVGQLQRELRDLREKIRELHHAPKIKGPLDMQGHRIMNVGRTQQQGDVAPRAELIDKAMYDNGFGQHIARSPIIATSGIRGKRNPTEPDEMATVGWVRKFFVRRGDADFTLVTLTGITNGVTNHNISLSTGTIFAIRSPTAAFTITGLVAPTHSRYILLYNATAHDMTLANASGLSTVGNRIFTCASFGADTSTTGQGVVALFYDDVDLQWVVVGAD